MSEKFNLVKKGYNPSEVDDYVSTLENVLKSYKEKDNAIKNAILNAQIAADNIMKNAEFAVEDKIQSAEKEALRVKQNALLQLDDIKNSITHQRKILHEFQTEYNALLHKYLHQINDSDISEIYTKINALEQLIVDCTAEPQHETEQSE